MRAKLIARGPRARDKPLSTSVALLLRVEGTSRKLGPAVLVGGVRMVKSPRGHLWLRHQQLRR
jgi:hypothetical protein